VTVPSKTFCILPWIHLYSNPDGTVLPCCVGDWQQSMGNVQDGKLETVFNNESFKTMRRNMLAGEKCSQCTACYRDEDAGNRSFRKHSNEQFAKYIEDAVKNTNPDGTVDDFKLRYLDVRWSNICNFKCRSCGPLYSSSWAQEHGSEKIFTYAGGANNDELYRQFEPHFDTIEEFYFAGGEPLLTDKHYDILEYLIEHGRTDVKLRYNTNMSVLKYKDKNVLDMWKQFSNVYIGASLDSWGPRAEYIRHGTDWSVIESNIRKIRTEAPHIHLQTNTVVSILNIKTLTEFIDYMMESGLVDEKNYNPHFYNVLNPEFLSLQLLTDEENRKILLHLEQYARKKGGNIAQALQTVINGLKTTTHNPDLVYKFKITIDHHDRKRKEDGPLTFPELEELMEE
jgi:radical SAM protein with 4Fe4S-binding SPASM domain